MGFSGGTFPEAVAFSDIPCYLVATLKHTVTFERENLNFSLNFFAKFWWGSRGEARRGSCQLDWTGEGYIRPCIGLLCPFADVFWIVNFVEYLLILPHYCS